jgi:IMP dehydrogenase/GMP reductase
MAQLSAIMECADAAHGLNGLVVGDGGCTCPGDVAKVSTHTGDGSRIFENVEVGLILVK